MGVGTGILLDTSRLEPPAVLGRDGEAGGSGGVADGGIEAGSTTLEADCWAQPIGGGCFDEDEDGEEDTAGRGRTGGMRRVHKDSGKTVAVDLLQLHL